MPLELDSGAQDFAAAFAKFLAAKRELAADVDAAVAAIIDDVRTRGDAALIEQTKRLDKLDLTPATLRVTAAEIDAAVTQCKPAALEALRFAKARIEDYHLRQRPADLDYTDASGVKLGWRYRPDQRGRPLRARRHGGLSVLGADERGAGESRGRRAHRDGRAVAGRRAQSAGARRGADRRHR